MVARNPPIREQVAHLVREAIIHLEFRPGELLLERELCAWTGASRPTVREALRLLESEGLVEPRAGRGSVVRLVGEAEITHLYEVRSELEGFAAALAAARADDDARGRLRGALDDLGTALVDSQVADIVAAQHRFFDQLFAGAGNHVLRQVAQALQGRVAQFRALTLTIADRGPASLRELGEVVASIEARDAAGAREAAQLHVGNARAAMRTVARSLAHP
mgnify:CR=1 FL=1|jgi:Transcriptional regulators